jgi:hypothetical protein
VTISSFATEHRQMQDWTHVSVRRAYREHKRHEAEVRQAAFDAEVAKVMREQNCGPVDARHVVNARRHHEQRLSARQVTS